MDGIRSLRLALIHPRVEPARGGAETYVVDLCHALVAEGHRVDVVTSEVSPGVLPAAAGLIRVPARGATRLGRLVDFARASERIMRPIESRYDCTVGFINTWHHDVIVPQGGLHAGSLTHNARRLPPGPPRWLYRLSKRANPKDWVYRWIERRQYDAARGARVVAVSQLVAGHLEHFRGVSGDRVRVIPNAIDAGRLEVVDAAAERARFRARLGLGDRDLIGLFVGHNPRLKGLPALFRAMGRWNKDRPEGRPIHLAVCGGGDLAPFERLSARLGLSGRVHLLGFQDDIRPCFHGSDFFLHPTYYDPCSLVVFEALACGLPVVTTRSNGAGEIMESGVHGFVLSRPDAKAEWSNAFEALADETYRSTMSAAARRLGREQSFDRHLAALIELFREVARTKRRRHPAGRWATGPHPPTATIAVPLEDRSVHPPQAWG